MLEFWFEELTELPGVRKITGVPTQSAFFFYLPFVSFPTENLEQASF